VERLTAEDRLMLWPDERWPQEIGALAVLDGAGLMDASGRFRSRRRGVRSKPGCTWFPGTGMCCACHGAGLADRCGWTLPRSTSPTTCA
jgi:hypothetical protein